MDINNTEGDEGTQLDQENWLSVGQGLSSCVAAGTSLSDVNNRINYSNCVATANVGQNFGLENYWFDTYTGLYFVNSTGFNKTPFAPPSETSTSQASHLTEGLPRASDMLLGCNYMNIPQYEFVMPHRPVYDLNYPPGIIPESSSSQASHFAPETPGRILNATTERTNLRRDQQEDLRAASRFNNYELHQEELEIPMTGSSHATAIIDRNNNKLHDTQLQIPITGSSNTTAITPIIDNLNTDNGAIIDNLNTDKEGCNLLESNKTPQPKPKRKKHRPKVVIEDKTKRPPGPATSKPASNEIPTKRNYVDGRAENRSPIDPAATPPSGEKVYVRKYATRAAATTFQAEATGETAGSENHQLPKKACRRTLNFDMEELTDESSQSRSTSDPGFEMQLKNKIGGNDSNPSLRTGQGVEVMMRATQAGNPYKVSDSGNQTLKENILLPERGKPDSVKSNPAYGEQNVKIHNNPQENGVKKKQTYEKEDQNMHINPRQNGMMSEQGNAPVVMLPIGGGLRQASLNGINCRDLSLQQQETSTVNHHFSLELPDSSRTNLAAVHCNNVAAYQLGSILQLPSICKKRRTEKKHTTLPGFLSSINAAKDAVKLDLTCQGWNHRRDASKSEESCRDSVRSSANRPLGSTRETGSGLQCNMQSNNSILTQTDRSTKKRSSAPDKAPNLASLSEILWGPTKNATERSTKKRSQIHVRARNMSSLSEILLGSTHSTLNGKSGLLNHVAHQVSNSLGQCTHKKALVTELHASWKRKKRTKRISLINSTSSSTKEEQSHGRITLYNPNKFLLAKIGALPELTQKQMFSVDTIAEQFQHLDINRENCDIIPKAENALIPYSHRSRNESKFTIYRRDEGAIVPFKPTRKRHPLPRVDLDEETNRVWKLLLENIDNEGIDGTDEEKVKWWEEERKVFSGRANSFIARMRLVQGDRRFSPWKGSIVDSVIGVFLTQNVSDHLSSSAFMSLAARFPLKTDTKFQTWCEESSNSVADKQIVHILDIEDLNSCSKEETGQSVRNLNTMRVDGIELEDERELVNNESSGSNSAVATCGSSLENHKSLVDILTTNNSVLDKVCSSDEERTVTKDSLSSQTSASSSQIPFTSPTDEAAERKEPSKENILETSSMTSGSEVNCLSSHTFMELLLKHGSSMLDGVYSQWNSSMPTDTNRFNKLESMGSLFERQGIHDSDDRQSLLGESVATSSNYCLGLTSMAEAPEVECQKVTTDGLEKAEISNNCQTSLKSRRAFTEDSASQITEQTTLVGFHEQLRSTMDYPWEKIMQEDEHMSFLSLGQLFEDHNCQRSEQHTINNEMHQNLKLPSISKTMDITGSISHKQDHNTLKVTVSTSTEIVDRENKDSDKRNTALRKAKSRRVGEDIKDHVDWDELRKEVEANGKKRERTENTMDSLDWEAVRCADVDEIAKTIRARGMNNMLAERIKDLLNRLVREHGSIDLEWLRDIPPDKAKEYLLSIRGLGLKSVECVRLLTLHHVAFPVDTNVGRIAVRLGWVPLQPLPESLQLHLLELYPVLESIQKYLWPRLCKLDQKTLYELHYQLITFGKVFCTKSKPNCNSCPLRGECRHFASAFASARLALPGPEERSISCATENKIPSMPTMMGHQLPLTLPNSIGQLEVSRWSQNLLLEAKHRVIYSEPIIEEPASPEPESKELTEKDIEDFFYDDPDEIPVIKLNIEEFTQNVQSYMQENMELVEGDMSKALVALTTEAASIPAPKLKNVSRLRTEHQVYELPDSHPLLAELERREPDDPCSYLLAIWSPGETADCVKQAGSCGSEEDGKLCEKATCFSCSSIREANSQIVRGTILIPCRTAMRGSFPLNGTYFQVNEVFADHESSLNPIDVPRNWIWNLPRRTVYFGTSIPSIFKGLTTELIQQCFWRGYVCVRGFDRKTRAPRPLRARLHFPASRLTKTKGVDADD